MKVTNFIRYTIVLILLFETKFLFLIPLPRDFSRINNRQQKIIITLIIITAILFLFKFIVKQRDIYNLTILSFIFLFIIEYVNSYLTYGQGIINVLVASNYFLIILAYYIFLYYFDQEEGLIKFKNMIVTLTIILNCIFLLQFFGYSVFRLRFLQISFSSVRFNELRIYEAGDVLIVLGMLFSISFAINEVQLKRNVINIILSFYNIIFVAKGRATLIIVLVCTLIMILFKYRNNLNKIVLKLLIISSIIGVFMGTSIVQQYTSSFSNHDKSFSIRNETISMYLDQLKEHPILGMGFIRDMEDSDATILLRGPKGSYTRTDVGIVGFANCFGIVGVLWYICMLIKLLKYIVIINKKKLLDSNTELIGLYVFLVLSSATLIVMDAARIIILPIFMALESKLYKQK